MDNNQIIRIRDINASKLGINLLTISTNNGQVRIFDLQDGSISIVSRDTNGNRNVLKVDKQKFIDAVNQFITNISSTGS